MPESQLTFKEMCAKFDVTPRTLRYYEYIELLSPERDGRSRYYGPREVARLTLILRGRRWGFALEEDASGAESHLPPSSIGFICIFLIFVQQTLTQIHSLPICLFSS